MYFCICRLGCRDPSGTPKGFQHYATMTYACAFVHTKVQDLAADAAGPQARPQPRLGTCTL